MFHTHNAHTVAMASQLSAIPEHAQEFIGWSINRAVSNAGFIVYRNETICLSIIIIIVTLSPGSGIGFLIQVRTSTGQTSINTAADIWGTFIDRNGDNYQTLQCGMNQGTSTPTFNVR